MSPAAIKTHTLSVELGGQPIIQQVDLEAKAGELLGLVGPNGAGKTTLLRAISGLLKPKSGDVLLGGEPIDEMAPRTLAKRLALLPQDHVVHWAISVEDLVALGRLPHRGFGAGESDDDRQAVLRALDAMDLNGLAKRPVTELSGGERARALIARALAQDTDILLADEPAAGLDAVHQLDLFSHLRLLADDGRCVVVVLHDLTLASRFCDRITVLDHGQIHASGKASKVLTAKVLKSVYGITAYRGTADGVPFVVPLKALDTSTRPRNPKG